MVNILFKEKKFKLKKKEKIFLLKKKKKNNKIFYF
jgi:hypothetical protein